MSMNNSNIPVIAITPDEESNIDCSNYMKIEEVATDVEDIYFQTEKRKKKIKKHVIKKDVYVTDTEDLEGSDDDLSSILIKHTSPVSLSYVLETDIPTIEENYKTGDTNIKNKPQLKTQASVTSSTQYLHSDATVNQVLTDLEDFNDSEGEDEMSEVESDTDLLKEIIYDSGTIAISDSVKKFLQAVPSPMITPVPGLSDDENNKREPKIKQVVPKKKNKQFIGMFPISSNFNELTDTEVLEYELKDEKQKYRHGKFRRHTLPRKIKLDTTDTEDLEMSDNEQIKQRRVTIANIHQPQFEISPNSVITVPQVSNEGDSDIEDIQFFNKHKNEKEITPFLNVNKEENEGTTDVEDMYAESEVEEDNCFNEDSKYYDYIYEFETTDGVIEEKHLNKENNKVYKIEESYIKTKKINKSYLCENDTDEEENYDDIDANEMNKQINDEKNVTLNFVCRNKSNNLKKNHDKASLTVHKNEDDSVLTDVENLDSSEDDKNEIPVTVANNNLNNKDTDSESMEGEAENAHFDDIPENFFPSCSRNMIYMKVDKNNISQIFSTTLKEVDLENDVNTVETDNEEISGYEIQDIESNVDEYDLNIIEENNTEYKDILKLPIIKKEEDEDTDVEDISKKKSKISKVSTSSLSAIENDLDKNTDIEDLELNYITAVDHILTLNIDDNFSNEKTDIEDFDASDNDQNTCSEYSRTPDVLKQMGGNTICSKEGIGHFSKNDLKKLNEKHHIINITAASPSPTYTDEFLASAEDDNYSRAETATPLQMTKALEEASSCKIHSQTNKKMDLEADDEVMYLKGGGFMLDNFTDSEEVGISEEEYFLANDQSDDVLVNKMCFKIENNSNTKLNISAGMKIKEWGPAKETPSETKPPQEPASVLDAAHQDSEETTGNQRTLRASGSKPESSSKPTAKVTSYSHLDKLLDHMLAEVDEQERLVKLDNPQKLLKPVCINSLKLVPSTDAVIEIPASHFQSPKIFETKHEIILTNDFCEYTNNDNVDLDDEISLITLNKSQDTESLFSFESISESYFLENLSNKYKASTESLNDLETHPISDNHIYEIIEPKNNCEFNQKSNDDNIWWEGTYRDLSIVAEEDEDNISEISQCINGYKSIINEKYDYSKFLSLNQPNINDYDNLSHSSSDVSQTTGEEYDTSDVEHGNKPVKAEIKLLVKTLDKGKEDIEIRTVREFSEKVKNENLESLTHTLPKKVISTSKPSFILQRLFVRCPETSGFLNPVTKELSKSNPELIATSNIQYPLHYDPNLQSPQYFKNVTNPNKIDLYANTPFYPCYESYIKTENVNLAPNESQNFPNAYCDWLLQPDVPNGGITTSPTQLVSNEVFESKIVTGESIIRDVMSKDIKPVIDQTKTFIRMESQLENANVCSDTASPSQTKLLSPDLPDKASKELDNKKEKSKSSKGFFSSLKSLVGRSLDSSDSESKEEKTPKKKKKEKGIAKKGKKTKEKEVLEVAPVVPTPKSASPKLEKKTKALYESQELDNIPCIDEIESNGLQITDLDIEPIASDDVKIKATVLVDNVINDSQKAASRLLEGKIQEFNLEGTVTPEEVRRSTEPIIINEDEFLVVIEPNYNEKNGDYEDIQNPDAKIIKSPESKQKVSKKVTSEKLADKSDDEGKTDSLKRKSVGFLKLFSKKDSKESDDESRGEDHKQIIQKTEIEKSDQKFEEQHRKSSGFFGLFSKKSKEEESIIEEKDDFKIKKEITESSAEEIEFSKNVQQQMIETADFLLKEVEYFEDVRYVCPTKDKEIKKFIQSSESEIIKINEDIQQQMIDSADFLMKEIEFFEDVRPQTIIEEVPVVQQQITEIEASNVVLSQEVQEQIVETANFLLSEIENFEDVRPVYNIEKNKTANTKIKDKLEKTEPIKISEEVQQQMIDTSNFLFTEIEYFDDVKTRIPVETELKESTFDTVTSVTIQTDEKKKVTHAEMSTVEEIEVKSPDNDQKQDSDEQSDSKPGFFSKLGEKFSKSTDKKEEAKEKKLKKKKEKKTGFFSKIGERLSGTLSDEEKDMKDKLEKKSFKIENKLKNIQKEVNDKEENLENKIKDIGESVISTKDKTVDKIEESATEVKQVTIDSTDKIQVILPKVEERIESDVKDVKDVTVDKVKETVADTKKLVKDSVETVKISYDIDASVKKVAIDTKETAKDSKEKIVIKIKDTAKDAKEIIVDNKDATIGKIDNVEESIKETVKETKEIITCAKDITDDKVKQMSTETTDSVKDTNEKLRIAIFDLKDNIQQTEKDAKDKIISVKDSTMDITKEAAGKTGGFFSGLGKILKGTTTAKDAKEEIIKISDTTKDSEERTSDKIKETTKNVKDSVVENIKETSESNQVKVKDAIEKTEEVINEVGHKIKKIATDSKDSAISIKDSDVEKIKDTSENINDKEKEAIEKTTSVLSDVKDKTKETVEKTGGFFSGLGKKFKGAVKDGKEEIEIKESDAKDALKSTTNKVDDKIKETAKYTKNLAISVKDNAEEKAKNAVGIATSTTKEVIDKTVTVVSDTKDKAVSVTDTVTDKIKDIAEDTKCTVKEAVNKPNVAVSDVKDKINETKDSKDLIISTEKITENVDITKDVVKEAVEKSNTAINDAKDQIKDTATSIKNSASDKVKETSENIKEKGKEAVEKTGGFFSGLGKKFKSTKDDVTTKISDTKEIVKDTAKETKDITAEKIKDAAKNTKDLAVSAKDSATAKVEDNIEVTKETAKEAIEKTSTVLSDVADKVKETAKETSENVKDKRKEITEKSGNALRNVIDTAIIAKDSSAQKVKETSGNFKETGKDVIEKTGEFFNGLGSNFKREITDTEEKIKMKVSDVKEATVKIEEKMKEECTTTQESTIEKVKDNIEITKDNIIKVAGDTCTAINDGKEKIKNIVEDSKDSAITIEETTVKNVKETVEIAKDNITEVEDKLKEIAKDAKDVAFSVKDSSKEKFMETFDNINDKGKEVAEKSDGFFSGLGKKFKEAVKDTTEEIETKAVHITDGIKENTKETTDKTDKVINDVKDKIKESATDAKDTVMMTKDLTVENLKDTSENIKEKRKEAAENREGFFSGLEKKFKSTKDDGVKVSKEIVEDTTTEVNDRFKDSVLLVKDGISEKVEDGIDTTKNTIEKSFAAISDAKNKIKDTITDFKDSTMSIKDDAVDTLKETTESSKDAVNETTEKTNVVLTSVKEKVKETTKKATNLVDSAKDSATEKDTVEATECTSKKSVVKTPDFVIHTKDKVKKTVEDIKDITKPSKETERKQKEIIIEAKDSAISAKDVDVEKIDLTASDIKEKTKETVEKIEGFFSGFGKKITDTTKKAKEEVSIEISDTKKSAIDAALKTEKTLSTTGEQFTNIVKDSTEKAVETTTLDINDVNSGIKDTVKDAKETTVIVKDIDTEERQESALKVKDTTKKASEKISGFFSEIKPAFKDTADDLEEEGMEIRLYDVKDKIKESVNVVKDTVNTAEDSAVEKIQTITKSKEDSIKELVKKTETAVSKVEDKMKESPEEIKNTTISLKDNAKGKTKETAKIGAEKAGGFFSELGQIFKGTIKETQEEVQNKTSNVKDTIKDIADITTTVIDIGDETSDEKIVAIEKVQDAFAHVTDLVSETKDQDFENKIKETTEDVEKTTISAKDKDSVVDKIEETISDVKDIKKETTEKTSRFFSGLGNKAQDTFKKTKDDVATKILDVKETVKDLTVKTETAVLDTEVKIKDSVVSVKDTTAKKLYKTTEKTEDAFSETKDKMKDFAKDVKEAAGLTKDNAQEKVSEITSNINDTTKQAVEKTSDFFGALEKTVKGSLDKTLDTAAKTGKSGQDKIADTAVNTKEILKDSVHKIDNVFSHIGDEIKSQTKDIKHKTLENEKLSAKITSDKTSAILSDVQEKLKDAKENVESIKDSAAEKIKKDVFTAKDKTDDFCSVSNERVIGATKEFKVDETKSEIKKLKEFNLKDTAEKIDIFFNETKDKIINDDAHKVEDDLIIKKKTTLSAAINSYEKADDNDKNIQQDLLGKTKSDFICYVTTPTMQRKGIGGSQRLSKDERPALIDVSNMPIDISSDEDEYIVTEPGDRIEMPLETSGSSRGSPLIIESVIEQEELEIISEDSKRRPLFHIGSKDEESVDWEDKTEKIDIHLKDTEKSDTTTVQTDAQKDIDLIENKLVELGKALDDLEKVNIDLEPQESGSDDKNEHKLRRVERRFERMASETMDKDIKEAKEKQMSSPEVEAKREEEFRTIVSQLSQEEVSECQRLYSTLWDDVTFTPSEEWDSKTPDSQPDEIQDLPQGEVVEVVYMAPVTLNKDHLVNKAGIEVDVIPIKRSPCTSPLPKKKLQNKGRARSAMGFYKEKQVEEVERGSLPDLQHAGKSHENKLDVQKGSIMSAILKFNPNILKEKSSSDSTSSLYFNTYDNDHFGRRKSTDSLTKGTVVSAVKEWMAKSTPFSSTDNVRSTDAISLADTAISIFDDDDNDNDSVDMYSDSACHLETESSKSDANMPDIHIFSDNKKMTILETLKFHDIRLPAMRRVFNTLDHFTTGETSGGPLTKITTEGSTHLTNLDKFAELTSEIPKPKPRTDKTPDTSKTAPQLTEEKFDEEIKTSEVVAEDVAYVDRKKFWETVSAPKKDDEKPEISVKKRMSLYEDQLFKQSESIATKKRTSVHEIGVVPPVPKPRSTLTQISTEEYSETSEDSQEITEIQEVVTEKSELVSEYRAAFKDPTLITETKQETETKTEKSESLDSETEYLKYEHEVYENLGYLSDEQEIEQKLSEKLDTIPQIKRRQMSVSQPPIAAARKTVFERSASLPTEDLQDVSETSVKARKHFFEQQLKKEMVIDQLMTQLEEEELPEHKTLTSTEELHKDISPEEKLKIEAIVISVKESEKDIKEIEKKLSPISSSSSQDTKTEDDITQYTPTSVKDLTKYFQPSLLNEFISSTTVPLDIEYHIDDSILKQDTTDEESWENDKEVPEKLKQSSTESEQSISSERSIEIGSADELPSQIAEILHYKSDSISKPSDSLEVHVDKSEIEDSEKITDIEQDGTDVEIKSLGAEEYLSDLASTEVKIKEHKEQEIGRGKILEDELEKHEIVENKKILEEIKQEERKDLRTEKQDKVDKLKEDELGIEKQILQKLSPIREPKEGISNTIWEVSVQSQAVTEIVESVTEIPIERQVIVEKDEELSGSVKDESDLGSEIHQDHSESYDSERGRSDSHSEVEQLILESLYHQKINPEDARKIASELIDDIEAEIERRNLLPLLESDESEPPAPHPDVARNQISDYLRQLAESKGLDAKEVELVESVLARKQSELSKLGRHDTQTSSIEITDEDLKYSGGECDLSPSESHDNILEEQIEKLELESNLIEFKDKSVTDEEKFSEKLSDVKILDIDIKQDREIRADDIVFSLKTETTGKVETTAYDEKEFKKKTEQTTEEDKTISKDIEEKSDLKSDKEQIELQTEIELTSDISTHIESIATKVTEEEKETFTEKSVSEKTVTDISETEELIVEELSKKTVSLEGARDAKTETHEEVEGGFQDTLTLQKTEVHGDVDEEIQNKLEHKQEIITSEDGTEIKSELVKKEKHSKIIKTSQFIDHKIEEKTSVTTFIQEYTDEPITTIYEDVKQVSSDESKSSPYDSAKSPEDQISSTSSIRKDDSDTSHAFDKPEVVLRKTKFYKEVDTSSSSGNLKTDRRSGTDFEAYSSSGESHYHSFEQDSAKSRPCSSDVEGLMAAGSSEYESALTSQDVSSRSHVTSTEYHTAVSSLSSQSMKSLDSESSGHMASVEVSEASETLVPSTFELEGDILDGAVSQLLEDEVVDVSPTDVIEPYDQEIPEHIIRGDFPMKDKKSSFDTISDSEIHGESMDISEEDSTQDKPGPGEITSKMKRSQEMTFQPVPKAIIADSPQSDTALEMDERFGSSLEDGSVLSMSLSSQSDVAALRTVIEMSRRDSDKQDGSMTISGQDSMSASNMSLDKIQPLTTVTDSSTSTGTHIHETLSSVILTTSTVEEDGTQNVSTQVTSQATAPNDEVYNGPTQVDYIPEYDDVVETKKVRGHRRQESTSSFVPSMIPGFSTRTDVLKTTEYIESESEEHVTSELTLKEEHHEEMKDVDEMEENYETEADQDLYKLQKEAKKLETESDQEETESRFQPSISKIDSEDKKVISSIFSEGKLESKLVELMKEELEDTEPLDDFEFKSSVPSTPKSFSDEKQEVLYEKQFKMSISEKSSIEEGEAEAAFSMVAHISPAHKAKGDICPILEDEDAEKHELETRERTQKDMEKRRSQIIREQSPASIPDIMVTEHMTPLIDREFHYPDLELEEKETLAQTPASISSKSSEETDQGREYILDDSQRAIPEEPELEELAEDKQITDNKSDISHSTTVEEKTVYETETRETASATESPNSDSFEMLEKPDIIDDFVVIEEVAKEAAEHDTEGKSVEIKPIKYVRKHDEEVEEYLVKSAPTPLTRMTDIKYYPEGSGDELGPFDFEDSPPQAGKKSTGTKTTDASSRTLGYEYDRELEASKRWIEMQFQGDQAALLHAGYGYEMEFERGPLEDIKEEEATDFESSRIGSLDSQKQSIGSLGSVKDSFSSTPEYDVLAGRKFFTRSGEHDDVSMSSLQEFEHLERVISLENRRHHQGSQDSSSNGSFSKRYHASRSGQGDDLSLSSLKEFEGLETACIEAHKIEVKAKEEEALLAQIDEAQENLISESESCKSISSSDKKNIHESEEEDYEKRMFEIDEIIKQAQSNVEKFIDMKDLVDKTESMGRGDSLEEVAKVPDLELDEPIVKSTVHTIKWGTEDVMQTSTDSLDLKPSHHESTDSLDAGAGAADLMTASTDSIEYQIQAKSDRGMIQSDSIEMHDPDKSCMITSDSLELTPGALANIAQMSDSIDEDGSRIGEPIAHDQSSSSGFSIKDEHIENVEIKDQRAEYLLGSTDSLDPSSSTATHATYQYETDSVMSGSFTSGGSNTMVSSTDTIDPLCGQAHGVDIAAAVRKVWFDDDAFSTGTHFTTELLEDGSKPFVTEVIEPCEEDPEYSHTIHRKVELPAEIKKITFKGPNADLQLRQYIENFGEGEDVQETREVDKDGNVHIKRVVQKRFIVKADPSQGEKQISGPELESYLQQVSSEPSEEFDLRDPSEFGLSKQTRTDSDGTKTIYGQKFTTKYVEKQGEEAALKQLLSSIASDVTESSTYSEYKITRHVDTQQESTGSATTTFSGAAAANILRAQSSRRKPLRFDISVDDQTEVDPREHDWRFILPEHDEHTLDEKPDSSDSKQSTSQQRDVADQHQLSTEMKELLEEMEKHSKK